MTSAQVKLVVDLLNAHPQNELISLVTQKAHSLGMPVFLVGGIVRDLLLGIHSQDLDFVVEGDAIQLGRSLVQDYGGKLTAHARFRTATINVTDWMLRNDDAAEHEPDRQVNSIDLISARKEIYPSPAVLPRVKPGTILDDLGRRDFTINAMAIKLDGAKPGSVLDPYGGQDDLIHRWIQILHSNSFLDDPTRIYRAFRYEQRFNFALKEATLNLIPAGRRFIARLTPKRLRHELDLILEEPSAPAILGRLSKHHLLSAVHATLRWNKLISGGFESEVPADLKTLSGYSLSRVRWVIWMLSATKQEITSLNTRLHFDAPLYRTMVAASQLWSQIKHAGSKKPSQWFELLEKLPVLAVMAVFLADKNKVTRHALHEFLVSWRKVKPHTTGHQLKELGLKPGKNYAIILKQLQSAWLDGEISSVTQERQFLKKLIR